MVLRCKDQIFQNDLIIITFKFFLKTKLYLRHVICIKKREFLHKIANSRIKMNFFIEDAPIGNFGVQKSSEMGNILKSKFFKGLRFSVAVFAFSRLRNDLIQLLFNGNYFGSRTVFLTKTTMFSSCLISTSRTEIISSSSLFSNQGLGTAQNMQIAEWSFILARFSSCRNRNS